MDVVQFSGRIRDLCTANNITLKVLLSDCGMNKGALNDVVRKKSYPSIDKVARIADYLNVSVDYLLGRSDSPTLTTSAEDVDRSTADGAALLALYNRLSPVDRAKLLLYADNLARNDGNDSNSDGNDSGGV